MTRPVVLHVIPGLVTDGAEHMLTSLVTAKRAKPYPQAVANLMTDGAYAERIRAAGVPLYELGLNLINAPIVVLRVASDAVARRYYTRHDGRLSSRAGNLRRAKKHVEGLHRTLREFGDMMPWRKRLGIYIRIFCYAVIAMVMPVSAQKR